MSPGAAPFSRRPSPRSVAERLPASSGFIAVLAASFTIHACDGGGPGEQAATGGSTSTAGTGSAAGGTGTPGGRGGASSASGGRGDAGADASGAANGGSGGNEVPLDSGGSGGSFAAGATGGGSGGTEDGAGGDVRGGTAGGGATGMSAGGASGGVDALGGAGGSEAPGGGASGGSTSSDAPSCARPGPGRTTCGTDEDESCCVSLEVEGGTFYRTYQNAGDGPTSQADEASISAYRLDKYEITVGRFREYVAYLDGGGSPPAPGSGKHVHLHDGKGLADSGKAGAFESGWDAAWSERIPSGTGAAAEWNTRLECNSYASWTDEPGDNEMLPLTCLNWWESYAFCIWDGGFLPSEAEWKYAAAGGDELRMYPWGSTNPGTDSQYAIYDCCYPDEQCRATTGLECPGIVNAAPVGFASLGAGRYGQLDLVGSVFEWLVDRHASYASPCVDCAFLTGAGNNRVLPGGGFRTTLMPYLLSSNRSAVSYAETFRGDFAVGARCARTP